MLELFKKSCSQIWQWLRGLDQEITSPSDSHQNIDHAPPQDVDSSTQCFNTDNFSIIRKDLSSSSSTDSGVHTNNRLSVVSNTSTRSTRSRKAKLPLTKGVESMISNHLEDQVSVVQVAQEAIQYANHSIGS